MIMKHYILILLLFGFVSSIYCQSHTPGYYHKNEIHVQLFNGGPVNLFAYERSLIVENNFRVNAKVGGFIGNNDTYAGGIGAVLLYGKSHCIEMEFLETWEQRTASTSMTLEKYSYQHARTSINTGYRIYTSSNKLTFRVGLSNSFSTRNAQLTFGNVYIGMSFNFS